MTAAVLTLLGAVGPGAGRPRAGAAAPVGAGAGLVTNLLVLPVAYDLVRGGRWYVGGAAAAAGAQPCWCCSSSRSDRRGRSQE